MRFLLFRSPSPSSSPRSSPRPSPRPQPKRDHSSYTDIHLNVSFNKESSPTTVKQELTTPVSEVRQFFNKFFSKYLSSIEGLVTRENDVHYICQIFALQYIPMPFAKWSTPCVAFSCNSHRSISRSITRSTNLKRSKTQCILLKYSLF